MCKKNIGTSNSRRGTRAAYHNDCPRDFGPWIAYTVSLVSDTSRPPIRQGGREMSAARPYETSLSSTSSVHTPKQDTFVHLCKSVSVISSIWNLYFVLV